MYTHHVDIINHDIIRTQLPYTCALLPFQVDIYPTANWQKMKIPFSTLTVNGSEGRKQEGGEQKKDKDTKTIHLSIPSP